MRMMLTSLPFRYTNIVIVFGAPSASFHWLHLRCCLCPLLDRRGFACYPGSVSNFAVGASPSNSRVRILLNASALSALAAALDQSRQGAARRPKVAPGFYDRGSPDYKRHRINPICTPCDMPSGSYVRSWHLTD